MTIRAMTIRAMAGRILAVAGAALIGAAQPAAPPPAVLAAVAEAGSAICGLRASGAELGGAAVQARIEALRARLAELGETRVPAFGAAALPGAVAPQHMMYDCRGAVTAVLRARLVEGGVFGAAPQEERRYPKLPAPVASAPPPKQVRTPLVVGDAPPPPAAVVVTPGPAAAPAAAPALSAVDAALVPLSTGVAAFNPPDRAVLGQPAQVEARLSVTQTADQLAAELPGGGGQSAPLKVSQQMSATLDGGGAFDVSPAGPQTQFVSGKISTVWDWTVTPKLQGRQTLTLSFDVILRIGGTVGQRHITTLQRTITVAVAPPQGIGGWLDAGKRAADRISWLWSIPPVAAGLAFGWKWLTGRGKAKV
jgi:hypothetical protein